MRDIRFKAKRIDNSEWVEGYYYKECDNTYIIEDRQKDSMLNRNEAFLVDPSTVCQFTGLKDKDGKDIFENDVIEITYENGYIQKGVVEYLQDTFIGVNGGIHIHICLYGGCDKDILKRVVNLGSKFDRKEGEK